MLLNIGVIGGCWKISWKDKFSNSDVLKGIREKEPRIYREIVRQWTCIKRKWW